MSLITGAGRSGLDAVGKWSLIIGPILFVISGAMVTLDPADYGEKLVAAIAAGGDTAKWGLVIGVIGITLYARGIMGLARITPEAGNAQARMRVAVVGVAALLAVWTVQSGVGMAIAENPAAAASAGSVMLGIGGAGTILAFLTLIPFAGGIAAGGLVNKNIGWVLFAIAIIGLLTALIFGTNDETGSLILGILQMIWAVVTLVIGIIMISGDCD
ncbi:MAG: hypothetical protein QGF24_09065 [Dehalococcoidia bacterium]|nr:hypothetical protein [Dehalococcoidia bacterium]|tara:strand:+ start:174 stop:818 length:645 start_codon:yes stop_codon:yes gene_type:complete